MEFTMTILNFFKLTVDSPFMKFDIYDLRFLGWCIYDGQLLTERYSP